MRPLIAFAAIILAPTLLAQGNEQALLLGGQSADCPVGVVASPRSLPALRSVDRDTNTRLHDRLAYNIALHALNGKLVQSAQVKLIGIDKVQTLRASNGGRSGLISETFALSGADATVYTRKLTGVRWVELETLTYLDGEVWSKTEGSACRVAPGSFVPIDSASSGR